MPAALNEMFLQHVGGALRIFPAVPTGKQARFHQLRAPGGLLVDAEYDGTRVQHLCITCESDVDIRLVNPFSSNIVAIIPVQGTSMTCSGTLLTCMRRGQLLSDYHHVAGAQ